MAENWQRVAALSALSDTDGFAVKLGDRLIALYRLDGEVYAIDDVCTHEFAQLSQGFVEDGAVECPLHQARFDIKTGRCLAPPATEDLRRYPVKIEGDGVFVAVPAEG
jgi:3-phenylpropionate/trans-cinnamate dioxygenase ferredoxin subunit